MGFVVAPTLSHALDLDARDATSYMQRKMENYLLLTRAGDVTSPAVGDFYKIENDKLFIYGSKTQKERGETEGVFEVEKPVPPRKAVDLQAPQPLQGVRVAIDPGHIGGDWAGLEVRLMKFTGLDVVVKEGDLSFYVASQLHARLTQLGAEVLITRPSFGTSSLTWAFDQWLRDRVSVRVAFDRVSLEYSDVKTSRDLAAELRALENALKKGGPLNLNNFDLLFNQVYVRFDLIHRAEIMNAFNPDISFVIHFNSLGLLNGRNEPVAENLNMAFVSGVITVGELSDPIRRAELARLAITPDFENSVELCEHLVRNLVAVTGVQQKRSFASEITDPKRYMTYASLPTPAQFSADTSTGVYARNLLLTRKIKGPLCYGESLYQDNQHEAYNLSAPDHWRLNHVVEAYTQTVFDFFDGPARPPARLALAHW